jgi:hypothetical protein
MPSRSSRRQNNNKRNAEKQVSKDLPITDDNSDGTEIK